MEKVLNFSLSEFEMRLSALSHRARVALTAGAANRAVSSFAPRDPASRKPFVTAVDLAWAYASGAAIDYKSLQSLRRWAESGIPSMGPGTLYAPSVHAGAVVLYALDSIFDTTALSAVRALTACVNAVRCDASDPDAAEQIFLEQYQRALRIAERLGEHAVPRRPLEHLLAAPPI